MNDTQVVSSLLQFYKNQGMDLHFILDDPIFASLPLQSKISAIKSYADEIVKGTHPGYSPLDRKSILAKTFRMALQGGFTGAAAGAALGAASKGFRFAPMAIGAATGVGAGIATGVLEAREESQSKKALLGQLRNVASNPTDTNAIGALSIKGVHTRQARPTEEVYAIIRDRANNILSQDAIKGRVSQHMDFVEAAGRATNSH